MAYLDILLESYRAQNQRYGSGYLGLRMFLKIIYWLHVNIRVNGYAME